MDYEKLYIGGQWVDSASGEWIEVENPATRTKIARVPAGCPEDADRAVKSAFGAFPAWAATPLAERVRLMTRFLEEFEALQDACSDALISELGSPREFTRTGQIGVQVARIRSYIELAPKVPLEEKFPLSTIVREPLGVVACITPWNYPVGQVIQKVVPAMLMGNTVVLKPSQHTPLSLYWFTEAMHRAGFPAGVYNMVTGRGGEIGDALSSHPDVAMVSFTGSTTGGIAVARRALETVKRVSLELGGKSPYVILPGLSDYRPAIKKCLDLVFLNSGQTCTAFSRLIIPKSEQEAILPVLREMAAAYTVGDPLDESSKLGPVSSLRQFEKIRSYVKKGIEEGATLFYGSVPGDGADGYWVSPVIFTGVDSSMTIARDEIFGPVLCVLTYDDVDEAVKIANDTLYGLNAGVFGPDRGQAIAVARRIQAGNVYVNDSPRDLTAPFGGYRQSGLGREGGVFGLLEFTQPKAIFDVCK